MYKLSFFIILLLSHILSAQTDKKDLYITYDDNSIRLIAKSENDSMKIESYILDSRIKNRPEYYLDVDKSGNLIKNKIIKGSIIAKTYTLTYINNNKKNNPISIRTKDIVNSVSCKEIIYSADYEELTSLLNHFKNIYLVDMRNKNKNKYSAKKITITKN